MSQIGPIINGRHVEEAVLGVLRDYMPHYLADRASDRSLSASRFKVKSYARSSTVDTRFPENQLPCVVVRATNKRPDGPEASGAVTAEFTVAVGVAISDLSRAGASDDVWDYLSAIEAILVQHRDLDGFSVTVIPGDSSPEDLPVSQARTLAAGTVDVTVVVDATLNAIGGPSTPPDDPYQPLPDDPQVASTSVDVQPADD